MATWAAEGDVSAAPRRLTLWMLTAVGLACGPATFALAFSADGLADPAVHASLVTWSTVPYVLCGVVAWSRRPASAFGRLMVAAGLAGALSALALSEIAALSTVGRWFDLLPPVLFLHVFLAFPGGRLERRFERALVGAGYVVAFGLTVVIERLGGSEASGALDALERVQLFAISALCFAGIAILAARRRSSGWPLRRSRALLVDSFSIGLVMLGVLFMSHAVGAPAIEPIRWATFAVVGLAPIAFLVGLVHSHFVRAAVGCLLVELRADPAPRLLRDALSRSQRDPSLRVAF